MENIGKSPIFIGGLMKSGTSLLRKLISLHPNVFGGLETFWFSNDFVEHWKDGKSERQKWLGDFFDVSKEEMQLLREQSATAYDFFNKFMNFCTHRATKKRWVEKTPDNVFYIDKIVEHWPNAKILIMHREAKDVYASWKKNNKRTFDIFLDTAKSYEKVVDKWRNELAQVKIVAYSDLVKNPKHTMHEVFNFIGEEYIDGLENYQGDSKDYEKVLSVTGKSSPTTISLKKPIFTTSIGQWKNILSEEEISKINTSLS